MLHNKQELLIVHDDFESIDSFNEAFNSDFILSYINGINEAKIILNGKRFFDCIIIDSEDFLELLPFIRKDRNYETVSVVISLNRYDKDLIEKAFFNGANEVMIKPYYSILLHHRVVSVIERKSEIDSLTGVYTRSTFFFHAKRLLDENPYTEYAILRFDVKNFNLYNNTHGTEKGDDLLRHIGGECLRLGNSNCFFCRYDNDDFVCILENNSTTINHISNKILGLDYLSGSEKQITLKMGLCVINDRTMPIDQICERALLAINSIGDNIETRFAVFDESMLKNKIEEKQIIDDMEEALSTGQFELYFQPQYNQYNNNICGAEALIRWNHPVRGMIMPGAFIGIFERNGFITKIDSYVVEEVCKFQKQRLDNNEITVPISINLSRSNSFSDEMCQRIINTVHYYSVPEQYLHFEITESAYMSNQDQLISFVKNMKQAGFEIEMDDFGTGYSSLNALKDIPVDVLKLDIRFIENSLDENRKGKILSSMIRMAHSMGMIVIAEGVETKDQTDLLLSMGCIYVQGYFFDKPMPKANFINKLNQMNVQSMSNDYSLNYSVTNAKSFVFSPEMTLFLNHLLGAAGFIEYSYGNIEGIRFSKGFFEKMNLSPDKHFIMNTELRNRFDFANWSNFILAIETAISNQGEGVCETIEISTDFNPVPKWQRTHFKLISKQGSLYYLFFQMQDVDAEKRSELSSQTYSDNVQLAVNNLPCGIGSIIFKENSAKMLFVNERFANLFGYELDEYLRAFANEPLNSIVPEDVPKIKERFKEIIQSKPSEFNLEFMHITKCKRRIPIKLRFATNTTNNGELFANFLLEF